MTEMSLLVYCLCAVTSILCAVLLLRSYRHSRVRLLLWSGLCFVGLALNSILLVIDMGILTEVDLFVVRSLPALAGLMLLLYGMIWDTRS
jgi:hypothetical protein